MCKVHWIFSWRHMSWWYHRRLPRDSDLGCLDADDMVWPMVRWDCLAACELNNYFHVCMVAMWLAPATCRVSDGIKLLMFFFKKTYRYYPCMIGHGRLFCLRYSSWKHRSIPAAICLSISLSTPNKWCAVLILDVVQASTTPLLREQHSCRSPSTSGK